MSRLRVETACRQNVSLASTPVSPQQQDPPRTRKGRSSNDAPQQQQEELSVRLTVSLMLPSGPTARGLLIFWKTCDSSGFTPSSFDDERFEYHTARPLAFAAVSSEPLSMRVRSSVAVTICGLEPRAPVRGNSRPSEPATVTAEPAARCCTHRSSWTCSSSR